MSDSNEMMTQEAIDALLRTNVTKKAPAHSMAPAPSSPAPVKTRDAEPAQIVTPVVKVQTPAPKPASPAVSHSSHEECIAAGEIQAMGKMLSELQYRLSRLEAAVAKSEASSSGSGGMSSTQAKAALAQVSNIASQVEVISEGLRGTAGYNLNKTFKCSSCNTVGIVAIKVKCNQCGQENWWGWWPKKK
jgi:hypothetical protein